MDEMKEEMEKILHTLKEKGVDFEEYHHEALDNVLQREVPDQDIPEEQFKEIFRKIQEDGKVFVVTPKPAKNGGACCCEIAVDVEEDTYWIEVEFEKAVVEWEHFLNKVQA